MSVWTQGTKDKEVDIKQLFFATPSQLSNLFSYSSFVVCGFCRSIFIFYLHILLAILFKLDILLILF
jgi:hypothetical protein